MLAAESKIALIAGRSAALHVDLNTVKILSFEVALRHQELHFADVTKPEIRTVGARAASAAPQGQAQNQNGHYDRQERWSPGHSTTTVAPTFTRV
jgi:hypothetical protein